MISEYQTPVEGLTPLQDLQCKTNAWAVVKEHAEGCPMSTIEAKVEKLEAGLADVNTSLVVIRTQFDTATTMLRSSAKVGKVLVAACFALMIAIVGATWTIATRSAPSRQAAWTVVPSAHAGTQIDAATR